MSGSVKLGSIEERNPEPTRKSDIILQLELVRIRIVNETENVLEVCVGDEVVAINGIAKKVRDIEGLGCLDCTAQPVVKLIAIYSIRGDCGNKSSSFTISISNLDLRRCYVVEAVRDGATIVVSNQATDITISFYAASRIAVFDGGIKVVASH